MTRITLSKAIDHPTLQPAAITESPFTIGHRRPELWKLLERLLLVCLIVAFVVKGLVPAWGHLNSDFPNYYLVARLHRAGYPMGRIYEWLWFQRQKDHLGIDQGIVTFIALTPPSALIIEPFSSLSPLAAKRCWLVANLIFLLFIVLLLRRITSLGWERIALLMFLAFIPLRSNFLLGQMHILVLLLITFSAWLYFRKSQYLAGISLALAAALKIYPGLFLIFFIFKRQWRAAIGLTVGLLSAAVVSLYVLGRDACEVFAREILPAALRGETTDPYHVAWGSLSTLLRRLFIAEPELNPAPVAHLPWLYAILQPLLHGAIFVVFMWAIGTQPGDKHKARCDWAIYLFLLLFLSSQPAGYHFVVLMLTAVLIVDTMMTKERKTIARIVIVIYALICLATIQLPWISPVGWRTLLFFPRLLLMAVLGGALLFWMKISGYTGSMRARNAAIAGAALTAIVAFGFYSTEKHFHGQFENYKNRVLTIPGSLFASDPLATSHGILFSKMTQRGYTIARWASGSALEFPRSGGDWFHPADAQQSSALWAEQASIGGSRIVRFAVNDPAQDSSAFSVEIEDAQEPVVSSDGEFLAFLRPVKGRSSLLVRGLASPAGKQQSREDQKIAGADYDVQEMAFLPDHRIIFSSRRTGRPALYVATLSGSIQKLDSPACAARYPAVSPDGQWLAFSCEQSGNWQLHAMALAGNQRLQLTASECNSTNPAWTVDSKHLIYATDCGRGIGLTALAEVTVP